jgi:hypothetical protein
MIFRAPSFLELEILKIEPQFLGFGALKITSKN